MQKYQSTQLRAQQTKAVVEEHIPTLKVGGVLVGVVSSMIANLDAAAAARDTAIAATDAAVNAENLNALAIRTLTLSLPQNARGELDEEVKEERDLLDLFDEALGITPRTTALAIKRGHKVVAAVTRVNAYLAALPPPARGPISAGGKFIADLSTLMAANPGLQQTVQDRTADETSARTDLDSQEHALDRLNKRFYQKLLAEARTNPALQAALSQIDTETDNLPGTLSIATVVQGGPELLHILVSYVNGTGSNADERLLDWMVEGIDTDFTHTVAADLSGNQLGPFTVGQTVKIRTRTINSSGTRTSATRTLVIMPPA